MSWEKNHKKPSANKGNEFPQKEDDRGYSASEINWAVAQLMEKLHGMSFEDAFNFFKKEVASILTIEVSGKTAEELREIKLKKLEEKMVWAERIDQKYETTEATSYLNRVSSVV